MSVHIQDILSSLEKEAVKKRRIAAKPIHLLGFKNYYACIRACGNDVCGIATKNPKLVTCKNCLKVLKRGGLK